MPQPYQITFSPGSEPSDEWTRLGVQAHSSGNLPQAQTHYQQALRLDPRNALAAQNLAVVLAQSNMLNEALLAIERAALCDGTHSIIQVNRAMLALEADRIDEALEAGEKAVAMDGESVPAMWALAMVYAAAGTPEKAVPLYNRILDKEPEHPAAGPNSCFVLTLTAATPADLLRQRKRWYEANRFKGQKQPHTNDKDPDRVLRVGYVGGDFKCHSAAFIFARVLLHHSPAIEKYLYSSLAVDAAADHRTKAFQEACRKPVVSFGAGGAVEEYPSDRWRDITNLDDEAAEKLIREDKIDILVDLAGHTNGGRLGLFTRKPAPIQVTAWGFAHGVGCDEVQYFFADPVAVPKEERPFYKEEIIDLPCIVTIEPPDEYGLKGVSAAPYRRNGFITFGCYARFEKLSDDCLRTFAEILRRVPDSRLQLKDHSMRRPYSMKRVMSFMDGIDPRRLLFSLATNHNDHLLAAQQADIALDPFPHGGGVVALEQLWMGVPIVTLYGTQPAGRSGASILTNMGRTDWIAKTTQEYIDIAARMADDTKMLAQVRTTLRDELLASPVYTNYVERVEEAYRSIWHRWCAEK